MEHRSAAKRRLRQRPAFLRSARADACLGMAGVAHQRSPSRAPGAADRCACELGQALGHLVGAQHPRAVLGRRARQAGGLAPVERPREHVPSHGRAERRRKARYVRARPRSVGARLRSVARAMGRSEPLPAHRPCDRFPVRRQGAEHSRRLHLQQMGFARFVRSFTEAGHQTLVRNQRQQLRRRRRVRPTGPSARRDRRRRKRPSRFAPLQRRGAALRIGRPARRLFLSRSAQGPHRANLPPGRAIIRKDRGSGSPAA